MKIDEAIRLQGLLCESSILDPVPMYKESSRLGLEALKAVKESRRLWGERGVSKLPGETKD